MMRKLLPVLMLVLPASAMAESDAGIFISPMLGSTVYDEGIDDGGHLSIGVGYQWRNPWAIEFVYADSSTDVERPTAELDFNRWHVDGLYRFLPDSDVRPYLSAGIGQGDYSLSPGGDEDEMQINIGAGVLFNFARHTGIRAEVKAFNGDGPDQMNLAFSVGLHHVFALGGGKPAVTAAAAPVAAIDSDNDGIPDTADQCPDTPPGVSVGDSGCALDSDGDGVADSLDACPDTRDRNARIDADGCYEVLTEAVSVNLDVQFDNNSDATRPEHREEVRKVYEFMIAYPDTEVTIEGHTDDRGSAEYNLDLSQRRAEAIAGLLTSEFGISATRVTAKGYGESRPIADNGTEAGRQRNRRVVGVIEANVERVQAR